MTRCSICDWSPDTYSIFQNASVDGDHHRRMVKFQEEWLCSTCLAEVQETLGEFAQQDEPEELLQEEP
jgi:hypothetical protein